jgi:hypothetical protein
MKTLFLFFIAVIFCGVIQAQDKIYRTHSKAIEAKIVEVGTRQIKYTRADIPNGPVYTMSESEIDSIVYSNGVVDQLREVGGRANKHENIPQLNTWNFDLLGFAFLSVSQAYERRLKNGKIGFRVPLYIGFTNTLIAGMGTFTPLEGVYYANSNNYYYTRSFSVATGFNPRFYLFKHRKVRAFAGPEVDMGYMVYQNQSYSGNYDPNYYPQQSPDRQRHNYGTFTALGNFGLCFNPKDKFNMCVHGAVGAGNVFGRPNIGWTGVWQIGFSMGTNF